MFSDLRTGRQTFILDLRKICFPITHPIRPIRANPCSKNHPCSNLTSSYTPHPPPDYLPSPIARRPSRDRCTRWQCHSGCQSLINTRCGFYIPHPGSSRPPPGWVRGHGRHGGEAPALCDGSDDVGLDSSVPSHQGEGTKKTCFLTPLHSSAPSVTFRGDKGLVFIFLQAN